MRIMVDAYLLQMFSSTTGGGSYGLFRFRFSLSAGEHVLHARVTAC